VFPGFLKVFSDVTGKAAFEVLKQYPTPEDILNAEKSDIVELIAISSRNGLSWAGKKYEKLADAASDALKFRYKLSGIHHVIGRHLDIIEYFDRQIQAILAEIKTIIDENKNTRFVKQLNLLESIPGVGFISAFTIMCEIGDFDAFKSPKQLIAYFGIDPSVNESGKFKGSKNRISKRGTRIGRRALYAVAIALTRKRRNGQLINPVLYKYYQKKLESKPKKVALVAIMHKVSNIIFALLRDEKPFVLKTPEEHCMEYKNLVTAA
jgi:transposase